MANVAGGNGRAVTDAHPRGFSVVFLPIPGKLDLNAAELDDKIAAMLEAPADKPVIFDCRVAALANCFPMIPSGKAHHEMLLGEDVSEEEIGKAVGKEGKVLV